MKDHGGSKSRCPVQQCSAGSGLSHRACKAGGVQEPGSSRGGGPAWDHHGSTHAGCSLCWVFFLLVFFSTFTLLKGKKLKRCLENCGTLPPSSACPLATVPRGTGLLRDGERCHGAGALPICSCPEAAVPGAGQPLRDAKPNQKKKNK